jgi:predicted nucleotidyltransferase
MPIRLSGRVAEVLEAFAARVRERLGPDLLELRAFGSVARGEANEESDIDVLVLVREATFALRRDILDLAADLWIETGLEISPTVLGGPLYRRWRAEERPLVMAVEREGISL